MLFRFGVLLMTFFGCMIKIFLAWMIVDINLGLMAMMDMIALLLLSKTVVTLFQDYQAQWKREKLPVFSHRRYAELHQFIYDGSWSKPVTNQT